VVAVAALVLAIAGFTALIRNLGPHVDRPALAEAAAGTLYRISRSESRVLRAGEEIESGTVIRSDGNNGAVLSLVDGSRIEMRSQSELALEPADDGIRIRLTTGSIIVDAAKQRTGHLYVQTRDVTVSVVGTVFLVESGDTGSRVAVIQGEVHVQQGATLRKLFPGEQVTTAPSMKPAPVAEEISWSRNVDEHRALLEQAVVTASTIPLQNRQPRQTFDVVSVRSAASAGGGRGRGGVPVALPFTVWGSPAGCSGRVQELDSKRFVITNTTLYNLITLAYGIDCRDAKLADLIFGGAPWIRTDHFHIEAAIPDGSPTYTAQQLNRHDAPILQVMIQTLLADRFRFSLHRETRETPVYNLVVATEGKLKESEDQTANYRPADLREQAMKLGSDFLEKGMLIAGGHLGMIVDESGSAIIRADAAQIPLMFTLLYTQIKDRMIVDKTNLNRQFDFTLRFAATYRLEGPQAGTPFVPVPAGQSLFDALQEQLGLKLEPARVPMEVLVIDRVEKPAEN
jgi:uncharacterized protein (TIGR03435 family)